MHVNTQYTNTAKFISCTDIISENGAAAMTELAYFCMMMNIYSTVNCIIGE